MTSRSFFLIAIKLIAIFLLADFFSVFAQFVGWIGMVISNPGEETVISISITLLVLVVFAAFLNYLLFSTNQVIDKLALDKHFQEESFGLNIHRDTVLKIACIVLGGLFFIDALPYLIKHVISYKRSSELGDGPEDYSTFTWIIFYIIKLVVGYLLFTNSSKVAAIIERRRRG
jgi:hypothetical protein